MTSEMQAVLAAIAAKQITPEEGAAQMDKLMPKSNGGFKASQWGNATATLEDGMLVLRCRLDGTEKSKSAGQATMLCKAGGSVQDGARKVRYGVNVYSK